jgi:hypothetical protein
MRRFLILSVFVATFAAVGVFAQRGGGMAGGHAVAAPAPHVAVHAAASGPIHSSSVPLRSASGGHYVRTRSGTVVYRPGTRSLAAANRPNSSRRVLSQDVPGLGFDYPHLAAVGGSHEHGRGFFRDRDRNRPFAAFFPFFGSGYYLPLYDDYDDMTSADEEQQAEASEPDYYPGSYPAPPRPGDTPEGFPSASPAASASIAAAAEHPVDEYVFVRRDGTLFFAVAYTWADGNLRYVTSEGLRRSVAGDTLDLGATQQFNEQRGLSFRVPAA